MVIDTDVIKKALIAGTKTTWGIMKKAVIMGYTRFKSMKKSHRIISFVVLAIIASFLVVGLFSGRELSIKEHLAKAQEYARAEDFASMIPHLTVAAKKGS